MKIIWTLLSWWKLALAGLATAAALLYRWRSNYHAARAEQKEDALESVRQRIAISTTAQSNLKAVAKSHKREAKELQTRRRQGDRSRGLGKW